MASAIGVARTPTHGSWRPLVITSSTSPLTSMLSTGRRKLEVGLSAIETNKSWPELIPPSVPPALFEVKPSGVRGSLCSEPLLGDGVKAGANFNAFDSINAHHAVGDVSL